MHGPPLKVTECLCLYKIHMKTWLWPRPTRLYSGHGFVSSRFYLHNIFCLHTMWCDTRSAKEVNMYVERHMYTSLARLPSPTTTSQSHCCAVTYAHMYFLIVVKSHMYFCIGILIDQEKNNLIVIYVNLSSYLFAYLLFLWGGWNARYKNML